jgi:hypothetical protein
MRIEGTQKRYWVTRKWSVRTRPVKNTSCSTPDAAAKSVLKKMKKQRMIVGRRSGEVGW